MYILTSPFAKTFDTTWLLYFVPSFLEWQITLWIIIEVPTGKTTENGVVLDIFDNLEYFSKKYWIFLEEEKIKSITWIVTERQIINSNSIELIQFISQYYYTQIHTVVNLFVPAIVRKKILSLDEKFLKILEKKEVKQVATQETSYTLSEDQYKAYNQIIQNFDNKKRMQLLYGVTGSGKTHIYMKLIEKNISEWKQSLLLIPEIILNNQIADDLKKYFWEENIIVINSSVTDLKKSQYFWNIYSLSAKIIVGTRSSLFYPYNNLGLIVMDEEHDKSYNSDKSPRYKTKEVLGKMQELNPDLNILLGSWTPSIEWMYNAVKWDWSLVSLLEKYKK